MAAGLHAALLGGLDDDLRAVDVAGDDVAAGVDQRVGGFRLANRHRPVAGEDHLHRRLRIDRARAEQHRIDVGEHAGDRLGGDEADLVGLGRQAGGDAVDVMGLVEIAEIGAGVLRVLVLVPQRRGVAELDLRIFLGDVDDEGRVIAERGRQDEARAVEVDHRLHRLGDGVGLGHVLFLDDFDARHQLERCGRDRMRLVPAEVVARADIDDADGRDPPRGPCATGSIPEMRPPRRRRRCATARDVKCLCPTYKLPRLKRAFRAPNSRSRGRAKAVPSRARVLRLCCGDDLRAFLARRREPRRQRRKFRRRRRRRPARCAIAGLDRGAVEWAERGKHRALARRLHSGASRAETAASGE